MAVNPTEPMWLSRQETAHRLGLTLPEVDRLIGTGLLDRYRIRGRYVRVLRSQVDELAALPVAWLRNA